MLEVTIRTWGSTSNLGPGFDVIGLALQLPLELRVHLRAAEDNNTSNDARSDREIELNYEHLGEGAGSVSSRVADNLILSTAATLARRFGRVMPWARVEKITVTNSIPLARGLGSSAAAIVAGCMLANQLCELELSRQQLVDECCRFEGHPDNSTPSLVGGMVACFQTQAIEHGTHEAEPHATHGASTEPLVGYVPIALNPGIAAVVVIPEFELSTAKARGVVPQSFSRADLVFNLQRVSVLCAGLSAHELDVRVLHEAMKDRVHQPYRAALVPGLSEALELDVSQCPGLIGACLSGAGPTILALCYPATHASQVGERIVGIFERHGIRSRAFEAPIQASGATVETRAL